MHTHSGTHAGTAYNKSTQKCVLTHSHDHIHTHAGTWACMQIHIHVYTCTSVKLIHRISNKHTPILSMKSHEHLCLTTTVFTLHQALPCITAGEEQQMGQAPEIASQCLAFRSFAGEAGKLRGQQMPLGPGSRSHGQHATCSPFITCTCGAFPPYT